MFNRNDFQGTSTHLITITCENERNGKLIQSDIYLKADPFNLYKKL